MCVHMYVYLCVCERETENERALERGLRQTLKEKRFRDSLLSFPVSSRAATDEHNSETAGNR